MRPEQLELHGPDAGRWLAFARSKARYLEQLADRMGMAHLKRRLSPTADTHITVEVRPTVLYIRIRTGGCPAFLNGLFNVVDFTAPFAPVVGNPDVLALREFYEKPGDLTYPELPGWKVDPFFTNQALPSFIQTAKPTMYSGLMRRVVQVLYGLNQVHSYSYTWSKTHGVYLTPDDVPWVIEVSSAGVFAYPMNVCTRSDTAKTLGVDLPFTPLPTERGENPRQLMPASDMVDFYSLIPFFSSCGWAFSYDGHEAANVGYRVVGGEIESFLYKLTIVPDPQDGSPSYATLAKLKSGFMHAPKTRAQLKVPSTNALVSVDLFLGNPLFDKSYQAPVYAFYDGNTLVECEFFYNAIGSSSASVDEFPSEVCETSLGEEFFQGTRTSSPSPYFTVSGLSLSEPVAKSEVGYFRKYGFTASGGMYYAEDTSFGVNRSAAFNGVLTVETRTSPGDSTSYSRVLVIPLYDREAVYVAGSKAVQNAGGSVVTNEYAAVIGADYDVQCNEACRAPTSLSCVDITITSNIKGDRKCDDGSRKIATGPFHSYIKGASLGFSGKVRGQFPEATNCEFLDSMFGTLNPVPYAETTADPSTTYSVDFFTYVGSQAKTVQLSTDATSELFQDIQSGLNDQIMVSVRDAFSGSYMISPDVNKFTGPDLMTDVVGYPVDELGTIFCFCGVPL